MYTGPLYICSDHAGYKLKKRLVRYLQNELKLNIEDLGPNEYKETDDYPDYIIPAAIKTVETNGRLIAACGSGNGECIAANKVKGIRAAVGYNIDAARLSIEDNNANVLCLAGRVLSEDFAMAIVKKWLETEGVSDKRHERRNEKIKKYEEEGVVPKAEE